MYVIAVPDGDSFQSRIPSGFTKQGTFAPCGTSTDGSTLWQYWMTNPETDAAYFITEEDFTINKKHVRRLVLLYTP